MAYPVTLNSSMQEPTSTLWNVLKIVFIVFNILAAIIAVFGFIGAVGLAAIVFADFTPKLREVAKIDVTQATIAFAFIVPVTILQTLYVIIGFIGICRLHLTSLYIYTAIVFLDTVLHFSLILVSPFSGFLIATFLAQVAFLFMMCYLIEELKRANGIE